MLVRTSQSRQMKWRKNYNAQQASIASDGRTSESCWEACRWITVDLGGQLTTIGWWWLASTGRRCRMASIGRRRRMAQEGTDVEVPLVSQSSCISAQVGSLIYRQQATSCLVAAVLWCADVTPSGALHCASKRKRESNTSHFPRNSIVLRASLNSAEFKFRPHHSEAAW